VAAFSIARSARSSALAHSPRPAAISAQRVAIRDRQSQQHDMQKLVLILGTRREEIDLAKDLEQIEARVDELEHQATEQLSP